MLNNNCSYHLQVATRWKLSLPYFWSKLPRSPSFIHNKSNNGYRLYKNFWSNLRQNFSNYRWFCTHCIVDGTISHHPRVLGTHKTQILGCLEDGPGIPTVHIHDENARLASLQVLYLLPGTIKKLNYTSCVFFVFLLVGVLVNRIAIFYKVTIQVKFRLLLINFNGVLYGVPNIDIVDIIGQRNHFVC